MLAVLVRVAATVATLKRQKKDDSMYAKLLEAAMVTTVPPRLLPIFGCIDSSSGEGS
jgi:hypothetical protein